MVNNFEETVTVRDVPVRIYSRETGPHGKIHGAYLGPEENWHMASWYSGGYFHPKAEEQYSSSLDLVSTLKTKRQFDTVPAVLTFDEPPPESA